MRLLLLFLFSIPFRINSSITHNFASKARVLHTYRHMYRLLSRGKLFSNVRRRIFWLLLISLFTSFHVRRKSERNFSLARSLEPLLRQLRESSLHLHHHLMHLVAPFPLLFREQHLKVGNKTQICWFSKLHFYISRL